MNKDIVYRINGTEFVLTVTGEVGTGPDEVMLEQDIDLTENQPWHKDGYSIIKFLEDADFQQLTGTIRRFLVEQVREFTGKKLEDPALYHRYVDQETHLKIAKRGYDSVSFASLGFDVAIIEEFVSDAINRKVSTHKPHENMERGDMLLRIVRPACNDNNPYHRDVWLDRLRNCINLYVPLYGSNSHSSLPLIPGSHLWKESEIERTLSGAKINGVAFTVPAVTGSQYGLDAIRPNPEYGSAMIFSPYLVHGGGANFNDDMTRISLEMRFWPQVP